MIKYYYKSLRSETMSELKEAKRGTWVHVESPSTDELDELTKKFNLEEGFLEDALDEDEVPRLEREDEQSYIFVRYAYKNSEGDLDTAPLLIVFGNEMVITISRKPSVPAIESLLKGRMTFATTQRTKLILLILSRISDQYDTFVSQTSRSIKAIRSRLRGQGITNQDLIDFVTLEDELNEFLASLMPTNATLRRLLASRQLPLYEEDEDLVQDLLLNNEQSIEAIRSNLRSIGNIRDAYSAISTNNLNQTITILTVATVLIALPNVFFGLYGMNVPLPFETADWVFPAIISFNLFIIFAVLTTLRKKRII
jgi:magnesium transporter